MTDTTHPVFDPPPTAGGISPLLIERWLPVTELGIESGRREANPRPPLNGFHVWWARRPLAACQGAQLAALLPPFDQLPDGQFDSEDKYRKWVLRMVGIHGDVIGVTAAIDRAKATGERLGSDPYGYRPAFNNSPTIDDLNKLHGILTAKWGRLPVVLDPTAGGGAIPFAAMRYGLPAVANDLNPIAVSVQEATLRSAALYGEDLLPDIEKWAWVLRERLNEKLGPYFEREDPDENVTAYLWVNTVTCPRTGGPVPLAPNWWLRKGKGVKAVATKAVPVRNDDGRPSHIDYQIITDPKGQGYDPGEGSVSSGDAVSPWDGQVVDGDWIKAEAQAGRMWPEFYAVACWKPKPGSSRGKNRYFRAPDETDHAAVEAAKDELDRNLTAWTQDGLLPDEAIPEGNKTAEPLRYGYSDWRDVFSSRQLLCHAIFVQTWRELRDEMSSAGVDQDRADRIAALLAAGMQNKAVNWNSRLATWNVSAQSIRSTFDTHNLAFKWTFAEFEAPSLWGWAADSAFYKFGEIARIASPHPEGGGREPDNPVPAPIALEAGSATDLAAFGDGSVECVNVDPPYYDNVMYAELADFFYVWEKRTLGLLHPERFADELTNKDAEAVANPARFDHLKGKAKKRTANLDYQNKMRDIFAESRRVLRDDGVMVVWFTHKAADAWDTLGAAIMDAGFTIETSWPVNTEPRHSLHHMDKNSAKSTIVLVCRKRPERDDDHIVFFEDIVADVRTAARDAAARFEDVVGHGGVDLLLSTYGPVLGVLSSQWPVMSSEADKAGKAIPLKPEEALAVARNEVAKLRMARLVGEERQFDPTTDFVVIAWDTYRAKTFPYDEARKLAIGVGSDVDELISDKVLSKSASNVELVDPTSRVARRIDDEGPFGSLYDAICVLLRKYDLDGAAAVRTWLVERGFDTPGPFHQALSAYGAAVPRASGKSGWTLEEARLLDEVAANVPTVDLHLMDATAEAVAPTQSSLDV